MADDDDYKRPPAFPVGLLVNHSNSRKFRLGHSIGGGGFGEIYAACDNANPPEDESEYPYAVKIEPQQNGPLFIEEIFYTENTRQADINNFVKSKKLSSFGLPTCHGTGIFVFNDEEFRFIVLERYGSDLYKLFLNANRSFRPATVFQIGLQMLDVLEYIHGRDYVHCDIKPANILLPRQAGPVHQVYLVDYGSAYSVRNSDFTKNAKSAHDGTLEYTSRDAHQGVFTKRGDLEILGYNMLQWMIGTLPWNQLGKAKTEKQKISFFNGVRSKIKRNFSHVPDQLIEFFEYVKTLRRPDDPDFDKCRKLLESYLVSVGKTKNSELDFTSNDDDDEVTLNKLPSTVKINVKSKNEKRNIPSENNGNGSQQEQPLPKRRRITELEKLTCNVTYNK